LAVVIITKAIFVAIPPAHACRCSVVAGQANEGAVVAVLEGVVGTTALEGDVATVVRSCALPILAGQTVCAGAVIDAGPAVLDAGRADAIAAVWSTRHAYTIQASGSRSTGAVHQTVSTVFFTRCTDAVAAGPSVGDALTQDTTGPRSARAVTWAVTTAFYAQLAGAVATTLGVRLADTGHTGGFFVALATGHQRSTSIVMNSAAETER